jgi:predicted nuclease with TOPRIM domain
VADETKDELSQLKEELKTIKEQLNELNEKYNLLESEVKQHSKRFKTIDDNLQKYREKRSLGLSWKKREVIEMHPSIPFLQKLEIGEDIALLLSTGLITGKVKAKYDSKNDWIVLSDVRVNGVLQNHNIEMTFPSNIILAWGMRP